MTATTIARKAGEGTALWVLGGLYEVRVSSEESGGEMTVMEMTIPPGFGPPPHTHDGGELVYVLEGECDYHIGGEVVHGVPGSIFQIAAGTTENFAPAGSEPLRVLVVYTPGGIDGFFREIGEPALSYTMPPPSDTPPDMPAIMAAAERYGMRMLPPA